MALYDWVSDSMIDDTGRGGAVRVGWLLADNKRGVLYDAPERIRSAEMNRDHAKSARSISLAYGPWAQALAV